MAKPVYFQNLDAFLTQLREPKQAAAKTRTPVKKAEEMGQSSHPSDDVDDGTQSVETGEQAAALTKAVKEDVPGPSVDGSSPITDANQDKVQPNIGTTQSATGEDPSVEDDYKGNKDDSETSHPATTDDAEKYSSMKDRDLLKLAVKSANDLLASFAAGAPAPKPAKQAAAPVQKAAATQPAPQQPAAQAPVDEQAELTKLAEAVVQQAIVDANHDAELVASYLQSYVDTRLKQADGGMPPSMPPGAGGPPGGGGDPSQQIPPDVLAQMAGGAGGAPTGGPPAGGPDGAGPADQGGGDQGGGDQGMSNDQAMQELAMALQEMGIDPEQLLQMIQQGGGGDDGSGGGQDQGPPPDAGKDSGGKDSGKEAAVKAAAIGQQVIAFKRAGKFRFTEAKTAQQRQARDQFKTYIRELVG
jgi:hypothetical protein